MYVSDNTRDTGGTSDGEALGIFFRPTLARYRDLSETGIRQMIFIQSLPVGDLGCGLTAIT